jgi:hypothetical protein
MIIIMEMMMVIIDDDDDALQPGWVQAAVNTVL